MSETHTKQTGEQTVEAIREDLACPNCEYNLRGLAGAVVDCPECGHECDIARLVTAKWTGKWYKAPGLNRLMFPVLIAVVGGLASLVIAMLYITMVNKGAQAEVVVPTFLFGVFGLWMYFLWRTRRVFVEPWRGPLLSLIAHLIFVGYMTGLGFLLATMGMMLSATFLNGMNGMPHNPTPLTAWVFMAVYFVIGVSLFYAGRRGEKFIAGCCIRRYLQKQSAVG